MTPQTQRALLQETLTRVRWMEASKFWTLRNAWHRFRRLIGTSPGAVPRFEIPAGALTPTNAEGHYAAYISRATPHPAELERARAASRAFGYRPLISVVVATHETPEPYLLEAIGSVLEQAYERWELCVADDASRRSHVRKTLRGEAARDERIKVAFRRRNGGISAAGNTALGLATGEFVVFLDHDDLLAPDALYEIVLALNSEPDLDVVYSDEDKVDDAGRLSNPHFKPDWCPESFLSRMYVGHLTAYRRSIVQAVGGLRGAFDGSQDYDLLLRVSERTTKIHHIARVLYHWRMHPASTAAAATAKPYARDAAERALNQALERRGEPGTIRALDDCPGTFAVRFAIRTPKRVSVIIPTRDHGDYVKRCVESALTRTAYPDLEIMIIDNGSKDEASLRIMAGLAERDNRVRVGRYDAPFNFSRINNYAVTCATGDFLLLLNDDTEALSDGWIEAMVEHAQRRPIGAVGALLLYPDESVQHAGVITGLGGVAGHSHKHYPADAPGYYYMLKALNNYSAVTAACMMLRREVFETVGGFDERLAVAFNDVDLCLRLREAGFRNVYVPNVVLRHYESKSRGLETTPEKIARFAAEIAFMKNRWPQLARPDPCYNPNLTLDREDFSLAR